MAWAIVLLAFFASSSALSRAFSARKITVAANFAKGGTRDWGQVAANGGVGVLAVSAAALGLLPTLVAWAAFAGAIATVNADTWATEIGVLNPRQPILITNGKRVPAGTSGAISALGTLAALAGAALIAALAAWLAGAVLDGARFIVIVTLAGVFGSFVDSLMGATVQAIYYCPQCKKETERYPLHTCGTATRFHRGWRWLNNDMVNFLSSALGALLAALVVSL
jgi:uncharacterized protein (TIGR00297 family)